MPEMTTPNGQRHRAGTYEFNVRGHLPENWEAWFEGLAIHPREDGTTILRGRIVDQSSLHSVLIKIRNMNLELISVNQIKDETKGDTQ
jgi:hypothetical protein